MLINLRNALMAGKRLPYQCELEYIESTGTQYIDTGYIPKDTTSCSATVGIVAVPSGKYAPVFVSGQSYSAANIYGVAIQHTTYTSFFYRGNNYNKTIASALSVGDVVVFTNTPTSYGIQNLTTGQNFSANYANPRYTVGALTLYLFAGNVPSTSDLNRASSLKVMGFKIYENGVLVHEYIPVLDWDGNAKMFDRVTGTYPTHYGTFVAGPEIHAVEYIESHGAEYIDTGVMSSRCYGAYLDFKAIDFASYMFFVCNATADDFCVGTNANSAMNPYIGRIRRSLWHSGSIDKTAFVALSCKGGKILLNDVEKGTYDDTLPLAQNNNTIRMFGLSGTQRLSQSAIRRFDLYNSSQEAIFKALAIRVGTGSTWEGAMMDVLTRRVYRNAGSGAFTYGNDLKYPIPAS